MKVDCFVASITHAEGSITTPISKLGGNPVFISHVEPPICTHCGQNMDFIGQIRLDFPLRLSNRYQIAYIFMCPGRYDDRGWLDCPTFLPFSGANAVLLQTDSDLALVPPTAARYPDYLMTFTPNQELNIDISSFALDEDLYLQVTEATKIGGVPAWIQNNETPHCPACGKPMRFVAQIDAELDGPLPVDTTQWNRYHFLDFGASGLGYIFICPDDCLSYGAFLWQTT